MMPRLAVRPVIRKFLGTKRAHPLTATLALGAFFFATFTAAGSIADTAASSQATDSVIRGAASGIPIGFVCGLDGGRMTMEAFAPNCGGTEGLRVMTFGDGSKALFVRTARSVRSYLKVASIAMDGAVDITVSGSEGWKRSLAEALISGDAEAFIHQVYTSQIAPVETWEEKQARIEARRQKRLAERRAAIETREGQGIQSWESKAAMNFRKYREEAFSAD